MFLTIQKNARLKTLDFTNTTQQQSVKELKNQFYRLSENYVLTTLVNRATTSPVYFRFRRSSCDLCNAQVLKAISKLSFENQARVIIISDELNLEEIQRLYQLQLNNIKCNIERITKTDTLFVQPKSYIYQLKGDLYTSFFIPEYDMPELLEKYFNTIFNL